MALTILWIVVGIVVGLVMLGALGIWGMWLAYVQGEEFQLEGLERKHHLRDDYDD